MKKKLLLSVIVLIHVSLIAQIPIDSLVAYYPFNGNSNDSSGNGFHALLGEQTLDSGICSSAYKFLHNYVDCGDPEGNEFDLVNDASISLWVKLISYPNNYSTLIGKDVGAGQNNKKWFLAIRYNSLAFHINGPGWGGGYWNFSNDFSFALDTFYHIVITKSGNNYQYYINATEYGSQILPFNILDVPFTLRIGKNENSNIDAVLDEIIIYHKVLTQQEVEQLYSFCNNTDINELMTKNTMLVFPNPASNKLTVSLNRVVENGKIQLLNILGEIIYEEPLSNESKKEIKLADFSQGIYFVKVIDEEKQYGQKIIVEHF